MDYDCPVEYGDRAGLSADVQRGGDLPGGGVRPAPAHSLRASAPGICHSKLSDRQLQYPHRASHNPDAPDSGPRHGHRAAGAVQRPVQAAVQEVPPLEEAKAQVDALEKERHLYPGWVFLLGYAAASGFFAAFFGGDLLDSLYAGVCGLAVGVWMLYMGGRLGFNGFIQTLFGAAIASLVALALVNLTPQQNLDAITIGTLMVLVPGRALTNAMWEIMAGDIISGVNRTAEALLTAAAIGAGRSGGPGRWAVGGRT